MNFQRKNHSFSITVQCTRRRQNEIEKSHSNQMAEQIHLYCKINPDIRFANFIFYDFIDTFRD